MAIALRSEIEIEAAPEDVGMSSERLRNAGRVLLGWRRVDRVLREPRGGSGDDLSDAAPAVVNLSHPPRASGDDLLRLTRVDMPRRALEGRLVLELGQVYNVPYCALLLAHLGADVINAASGRNQ